MDKVFTKKLLISCIRIILISYIGTCITLYFTQDYILYYPSQNKDLIEWIEKNNEVTSFPLETEEGISYGRAMGSGSCLIFYIGGNAEDTDYYFVEDRDWGQDCIFSTMNYRGFGASVGKPNEQNIKKDAISILTNIYNYYKPEKLYIVGRSLGTNIASSLATSETIKADKLILITPYDSILNVAQGHYWYIPVRWLIHDEFDTAKLAQDISTPTLILRASHDTIIPYKYTLSLVKSFQKIVPEVVTIDNTDHNSISVPRIFGETINNFFSN